MIMNASLNMFTTSSKTIWTVTAVTVVLAIALATATFWILFSQQTATTGLFTLNVSYPQPHTLDRDTQLNQPSSTLPSRLCQPPYSATY